MDRLFFSSDLILHLRARIERDAVRNEKALNSQPAHTSHRPSFDVLHQQFGHAEGEGIRFRPFKGTRAMDHGSWCGLSI